MPETNNWKERELGALWKKVTNGKTFLTGKIDGQEVVIFPNKFKDENPNAPDFRVYKSEPRENANGGNGRQAAPVNNARQQSRPAARQTQRVAQVADDSADIL